MARRNFLLALTLACAALVAPSAASADKTTAKDALRLARQIQNGHGVKTGQELTPVLRTLAIKLPELKGAERRRAEAMLARPTQGEATDNDTRAYSVPEAPVLCGTHFCVHYVAATQDAPPLTDSDGNGTPDYVQATLREFENVYNVENNQMGWQPAKPDGTQGGNSLVDVYLANIGPGGLFGYAAVDPNQRGTSRTAYLVMDNDYAEPAFRQRGYTDFLAPLQVTAAHEYNHVLQYNYDTFADSWLFEATATWMEDKVYDDINDYRFYLPTFAERSIQPLTQFNSNDSGDTNDKVYADAVLMRWIDQKYGADTIRQVWEKSLAEKEFAPGAISAALSGKGSSFFDSFTQFAADTAEWRASNSAFEEGETFPDMVRVLQGRALAPQNATGDRTDFVAATLDHTAYALVNVDPRGQNDLTLGGSLPKGVSGAIALVGRTGDTTGGTAVTHVTRLPNGGAGKVTLPNASSFARVTAVTINSDVRNSGYDENRGDWTWLGDDELVTLAVNDVTKPGVRKQTPKRNARRVSVGAGVSIEFNEPVAGVSTSSVKLTGPGGRTVKTTLSLSSNGRVVKLRPVGRLKRGARYAVKLTSAVTDPGGNPLPTSRRTSRFTTAR
jgi:hypothetical protein